MVEADEGAADRRPARIKSGTVQVKYKNRYGRQRSFQTTYEGIIPFLRRRHTDAESDWAREQVEGYMREVPCPACGGARLDPHRSPSPSTGATSTSSAT